MEILSALLALAVFALPLVGLWKMFEKAGIPGWGAIVPFYNVYLMIKIAGRPGWWFLLLLIPLVNIVIMLMVEYDLACRFGGGIGLFLGIVFLPFIFFPLLGFGQAAYQPRTA